MRMRELITRNLPTKLLSLLFAVVLWVVVIGEKQAQVQLQIPLEVVNIPKGRMLVTDIPSKISVQLQGPRTILRTINSRGIKKVIDLKGMDVGWTTIRILPDSISLPRGVEVIAVSPSSLELKLEPLVEMDLPVEANVVGSPPKGYRLEGTSVEPPKVRVSGGKSELQGLRFVRTLPIKVDDAKKDVRVKVGLDLQGLHLREISNKEVEVTLRIVPTR